jgi:aspartokinase
MTSSLRLGGFKVLKDVTLISLVSPEEMGDLPVRLFQAIADEKVNLPYVSVINNGHSWGMHILLDTANRTSATQLVDRESTRLTTSVSESAILSVFPHRSNPTVVGSLLEVFDREGIDAQSYSNSPSAVSAVVKKELIKKAGNALFDTFYFSAYRTPEDWKLAQKGKEQLYKEVVASYQEKKPKVYGLEIREGLEFIHIKLDGGSIGQIGTALRDLSQLGLNLAFISKNPCRLQGVEDLSICLPPSSDRPNAEVMSRLAPKAVIDTIFPVATFSMNGPHFGDRYGIAGELLRAIKESEIDLLALNCSIASIIGVVPLDEIQPAISAIQGCFEVPSITQKDA